MSIRTADLAAHVALVMQEAVFSAVELGNFPLQSTDVQCAFDSWAQDYETLTGKFSKDKGEGLVNAVRETIFKLGYKF